MEEMQAAVKIIHTMVALNALQEMQRQEAAVKRLMVEQPSKANKRLKSGDDAPKNSGN